MTGSNYSFKYRQQSNGCADLTDWCKHVIITCSLNTNGLCSHLHSQLFLHCHTACYFVIIVREAATMSQSSLTANDQELCPHLCAGRQLTYQRIFNKTYSTHTQKQTNNTQFITHTSATLISNIFPDQASITASVQLLQCSVLGKNDDI